jgi:hypothetical protein
LLHIYHRIHQTHLQVNLNFIHFKLFKVFLAL